jgi:hypothetical protein
MMVPICYCETCGTRAIDMSVEASNLPIDMRTKADRRAVLWDTFACSHPTHAHEAFAFYYRDSPMFLHDEP